MGLDLKRVVEEKQKIPVWDAYIFNKDKKGKFDKPPEEYTPIPLQKENNE